MERIGINLKKVFIDTVDLFLIWSVSIDNGSASSDDDRDDDELENEPVRLTRTSRKSDSHAHEASTVHALNDREHSQSSNRHSHAYTTASRPATANNGARSTNNVSFLSDVSKAVTKTNGTESAPQLKSVRTSIRESRSKPLFQLLDRLSSELNELEGITGYKSERSDSSSNTCSTALVTALLNLTGHVKQVEESPRFPLSENERRSIVAVGVGKQRSRPFRYQYVERSIIRGDQSSIRFPAEGGKSNLDVTNDDANCLSIGEQRDHRQQESA